MARARICPPSKLRKINNARADFSTARARAVYFPGPGVSRGKTGTWPAALACNPHLLYSSRRSAERTMLLPAGGCPRFWQCRNRCTSQHSRTRCTRRALPPFTDSRARAPHPRDRYRGAIVRSCWEYRARIEYRTPRTRI